MNVQAGIHCHMSLMLHVCQEIAQVVHPMVIDESDDLDDFGICQSDLLLNEVVANEIADGFRAILVALTADASIERCTKSSSSDTPNLEKLQCIVIPGECCVTRTLIPCQIRFYRNAFDRKGKNNGKNTIFIDPFPVVCFFDSQDDDMIADIMSDIMALANSNKEQNSTEGRTISRKSASRRACRQKQLADMAGITRQAVSAVEANQYSPATSVGCSCAHEGFALQGRRPVQHQERRRSH